MNNLIFQVSLTLVARLPSENNKPYSPSDLDTIRGP